MGMPNNLVIVRHGQSEGNIANNLSRMGDHSAFTKEFTSRHNSQWRLTDKGVWQAQQAGEWIKANIGEKFFRYYASEYYRAQETAAHLRLKEAKWFLSFQLRERDFGTIDAMSYEERMEKFKDIMSLRKINPFYWAPPNGESIARMCTRLKGEIGTLWRECDSEDVIIVCHGEVMSGFRILLERLNSNCLLNIMGSKHPHNQTHNCQIVQYSRINPETQEQSKYLNWKRSVCPWDLSLSSNEWQELKIRKRRYSNEQLLKMINHEKRLVNCEP